MPDDWIDPEELYPIIRNGTPEESQAAQARLQRQHADQLRQAIIPGLMMRNLSHGIGSFARTVLTK